MTQGMEVSAAFLEEMKEELAQLKSKTRLEVAERLKEAIALGDLSENSEYVEGRIAELEERIRNAVIIANPKGKKVSLGSVVTIKDQNGETLEYTIVGSAEADPFEDKISNESPVGKALIGKKAKDKVTVQAPEQVLEYEIVKVVNTAGKKKA